MNRCIITAQILSSPKLIRHKSQDIVVMIISIPNNKTKISFLKIKTSVKGATLKQLYDFYRKKDLCILEGNLSIYNYLFKDNNLYDKYKLKKYLYINIYTVQPFIKN